MYDTPISALQREIDSVNLDIDFNKIKLVGKFYEFREIGPNDKDRFLIYLYCIEFDPFTGFFCKKNNKFSYLKFVNTYENIYSFDIKLLEKVKKFVQ